MRLARLATLSALIGLLCMGVGSASAADPRTQSSIQIPGQRPAATTRPDVMLNIEGRIFTFDRADMRDIALLIKPDGREIQNAIIDDKTVTDIIRQSQHDLTSTLITAPRITLSDDEKGKCSVGTDIAYIGDLKPVQTAGKPIDYKPLTMHAMTGIDWQIHCRVTATGKTVHITTHPKITTLIKMQTIPWAKSNGNPRLTVEKPLLDVREADSAIDVPDGKTLVLELKGPIDPGSQRSIILIKPTILWVNGKQPGVDQL